MDDVMDENQFQLTIFYEYEFDNPEKYEVDSLLDTVIEKSRDKNIIIFIYLKIRLFMILILQILAITKKLI